MRWLTPSERAEIIIDFAKLKQTDDLALINEDGSILLPFTVEKKKGSASDLPDQMNDFSITEEERNLPVTKRVELFGMMGGMIHPFHIHGTQFKIISRDGEEPTESEQGWKDRLSIKPGERVTIAVKFKQKGIYMLHCHILEHEDNGMMAQIMVE